MKNKTIYKPTKKEVKWYLGIKRKLKLVQHEPILDCGIISFSNGDTVPYRRTKKFGYEYFNSKKGKWLPMFVKWSGVVISKGTV